VIISPFVVLNNQRANQGEIKMTKTTILAMAVVMAAFLAADVPKEPDPPLANGHVVQDGLLGTWRLFDLETQTFAPRIPGASDLTFKAAGLYRDEVKMLPNGEDSFFYASSGKIGENTDLFYLPLWFYTLDGDFLVIADEPAPALTTPGAAVFKKISGAPEEK